MEETVPSQQPQQQGASKRISLSKRARLLIIILIVLILALLPSYYFYNKYQKAQALLQNPNKTSTAEVQDLVSSVGKLIELPANENPTIATVSDLTKLQGQPFFAKAQNGDKVLIYSSAKKAILYRPSINKIIEVAPVNVGSGSPTPAPTLQVQSPSPSVSPDASPPPVFVPTPTSTATQ